MLTESELSRLAGIYEPEDLLPNIRAELDDGMDSSVEFDDDTLMAFMDNYLDDRITAGELVQQTARHALDRFHKRPGSGHEKEQVHAMKDDPVGLTIARERRKARAERMREAAQRAKAKAKVASRGE